MGPWELSISVSRFWRNVYNLIRTVHNDISVYHKECNPGVTSRFYSYVKCFPWGWHCKRQYLESKCRRFTINSEGKVEATTGISDAGGSHWLRWVGWTCFWENRAPKARWTEYCWLLNHLWALQSLPKHFHYRDRENKQLVPSSDRTNPAPLKYWGSPECCQKRLSYVLSFVESNHGEWTSHRWHK